MTKCVLTPPTRSKWSSAFCHVIDGACSLQVTVLSESAVFSDDRKK